MAQQPTYTALTGDLVASRKSAPEQRARAQERLIDYLDGFYEDHADALVRPPKLVGGDGLQLLARRPDVIVPFLLGLETELFLAGSKKRRPVVFGVGHGTLSTGELERATSVDALDGPCFHEASAALAIARKKRKRWAVFRGFGHPYDSTLTSLFDLMAAIRGEWTRRQTESTIAMRRHGSTEQVAQDRGISERAVRKSLQASHFKVINDAELAAQSLLNSLA